MALPAPQPFQELEPDEEPSRFHVISIDGDSDSFFALSTPSRASSLDPSMLQCNQQQSDSADIKAGDSRIRLDDMEQSAMMTIPIYQLIICPSLAIIIVIILVR